MKASRRLTRRAFITRSAQATATLSLTASAVLARQTGPRSFRIQAEQVRSVAVNGDGKAAVAADDQILFYGLDGTLERTIATAQPARAVAFDRSGRLFVTFKEQVARMNEDGSFELIGRPLGRQSALTGLAIADSGDIYAADSGERLIWRLDASGAVKGTIKPSEKGFTVPRAFFPIVWQNGRLLVADPGRHQIQTYSADGELLSTWGQRTRDLEGFGGCCNPVSFATLADGTIVTAERGQPRVKTFDARGGFVRLLAGPDEFAASREAARAGTDDVFGCQGGLLDVAAAPDGRIVLLDRTTRELRILA